MTALLVALAAAVAVTTAVGVLVRRATRRQAAKTQHPAYQPLTFDEHADEALALLRPPPLPLTPGDRAFLAECGIGGAS